MARHAQAPADAPAGIYFLSTPMPLPASESHNPLLDESPLIEARQGQRFYRSPVRFASLFWALLTNLPRQIELLQVFRSRVFGNLLRREPILPFKYLTRDYLVRGMSTAERAASLAYHYRCLARTFPNHILRTILDSRMTVLEKKADGHCIAVRFSVARTQVREGELALALEVDGTTIYVLQFTIVPGWVVRSDAAEVLLVSRLQGIKGHYREVQLSTKAFSEVAPPALLLAVLHGIAQVCSINEMTGISAESQFSYIHSAAESFHAAYDNYWIELGASRINASFYACPIPPEEKPLTEIKNGHRSRTRKKREFKRRIAEDVFLLLLGYVPAPAEDVHEEVLV